MGSKSNMVVEQPMLLSGLIRAIFALLLLCLFSEAAQAQTVNQYTVTGTDPIVDSTTCSTVVTKTFTVGGPNYVVADVNLGVFLTHTYRADLRITLTSPGGTTVQVMTNTGGGGDNLNDLFDDEAATAIASHSTNAVDPATAPPPYSHSFRPSGLLSDFDGQNAQGVWTMVICDNAAQDTGAFSRADLYITSAPSSFADLSVGKTVGGGSANTGDTISYTVTVTNAATANLNATGVIVRDALPAGLTFVSSSGFGSYNSGTGDWTVGSVPIGTTRTLTINATITAASGSVINNIAQVTAQGQIDLDSTPNNNVTTEDDYRVASFTVGSRIAGTLPTLSCPAGNTLLDWNNHSWTPSTLTNQTGNVTLPIGVVGFNVSTQGTYNAPLALTSDNTGGFGTSQLSLFQSIEYTNINQTTTTTVTLPFALPGAQFRVFDIDFTANDFADKLTVTGSLNGSPVTPVLTNGTANYISGGSAIGDVASGATSPSGNVGVTFSSPIDTITIVYGNHTTAPADPDGQAISIYDFTFCNPVTTLNVSKISSVLSDGVSDSNPKSIPGAVVQYCITVQNSGNATASNVNVSDPIPGDVTFATGSMTSGSSCGTATTAEDDNSIGADESDPVGMTFTGTAVNGTATSLLPGATFAVVFNATVD